MEERRNSIANSLELRLPCTNSPNRKGIIGNMSDACGLIDIEKCQHMLLQKEINDINNICCYSFLCFLFCVCIWLVFHHSFDIQMSDIDDLCDITNNLHKSQFQSWFMCDTERSHGGNMLTTLSISAVPWDFDGYRRPCIMIDAIWSVEEKNENTSPNPT